MKSKVKPLAKRELTKLTKKYPQWKIDAKQTKCTRHFSFDKHIDALIFVARLTVNAEIVRHYPRITFTYCKVKVVLTTLELHALTKNDVQLLKRIETLYISQNGDNQ